MIFNVMCSFLFLKMDSMARTSFLSVKFSSLFFVYNSQYIFFFAHHF